MTAPCPYLLSFYKCTRDIAGPFAKLEIKTIAVLGLNSSIYRNTNAGLLAYQYVYIPQFYDMCFTLNWCIKILDGKLYQYCSAPN